MMKAEPYPQFYLYRRIVQAKLFMDNNFSGSIDLDNIADEAYFSKFHFIRLFRKIYGKTPYQYLTAVRIEKAKQLLHTGNPVAETCYATGFESLSSFSGLFKRLTGISPSAYLEKQKKLKTELSENPLQFIPGCFAEKNGWTKKSNFEEVI